MSSFCRYLVGANTVTDAIVFVYGPCPALASEVVMVRRSGILEAILRDSKLIADGGFRGFDAIAIPYRWGEVRADKDLESRVHKRLHNRRIGRNRRSLETAFSGLKNFAASL